MAQVLEHFGLHLWNALPPFVPKLSFCVPKHAETIQKKWIDPLGIYPHILINYPKFYPFTFLPFYLFTFYFLPFYLLPFYLFTFLPFYLFTFLPFTFYLYLIGGKGFARKPPPFPRR